MNTLTRSPRAQNVLPRFYSVSAIIWLEGQDDVAFWELFFDRLNLNVKVKFSKAGNCKLLDKYINDIVNNGANVIAIRDRDYLSSGMVNHARVIYTYGHSLESTLYSPQNLSGLIALMSKTRNRYQAGAARWLEKVANDLKPLIELEVSNEEYQKRIEILGSSGARFLKRGSSTEIDTSLVNSEYARLQTNFSPSEIQYGKNYVSSYTKAMYNLVRGHFLTTPVKIYMNHTANNSPGSAKAVNINEPQIFVALASFCTPSSLQNKERTYLIRHLKKAFKDIGIVV